MPRFPSARQRAPLLLERLGELYPEATCSLHWRTPYELLVATMLSAQCTDERVNKVTPALFERFPDAAAAAAVEPEEVKLVPRPEWENLSIRLIFHGRAVCTARKPACGACPIGDFCPSRIKG
jgi:endonuclease III